MDDTPKNEPIASANMTANFHDVEASDGNDAERRVVRKMDWNIVPLVAAVYLLSSLDRSNIGNARIAGMEIDLDLYGDRYQWLLTIFYISYIVFEPLTLMWKLVKPHYWASFVVLSWGIMSTCLAATQSWAGAMVLRFLLGVFEAGYGPGVVYYLSFFYHRHEVGTRQAFFLAAAPLASTFAGALAYGITSGHAAIASWRLLFLVEGLPTIVMAPVVFFFLPDSAQSARFLTAEEKAIASARTARQVGANKERIGGLNMREVFSVLLDLQAWLYALMYFSLNTSFASLPVYLPTLLKDMGYSNVNAQGLSAPPFFVATVVTVATVYIADRTKQRGLMIMTLSSMSCIGYIILTATESVGARYFATFLVASGTFPSIANILPWVTNNQGSDSRRGAGVVILNLIGQCGPVLGTRIYPESDSPRYIKGHAICAGFLFLTTFLAFSTRSLMQYKNRQLDQRYGTLAAQDTQSVNLGENHADSDGDGIGRKESATHADAHGEADFGPRFRYIL